MRKTAFGLAILLAVTAPALAAGKKKANPNEPGMRLMRESIVLFLPTAVLPLYLKMKEKRAARQK